jgi:hypothetical protein
LLDPRYTTLVSKHGRLLHFDAWSFDVWLRKWRARYDGRTAFGRMRSNRVAQGDEIHALLRTNDTEGLRALYPRLYFVEPRVRRKLRLLGLVRHVDISESAFQMPGPGFAHP